MKWTLEKCKSDALSYKTKIEWQKNSLSYLAAQRRGWIDICCKHMSELRKPNGYWTKENCREVALKHNAKKEFIKYNATAYHISLKNNWCDEICSHMEVTGSKYKRMIYAYEFSDNSVYIGLTYNKKERQISHRKLKSTVKNYIKLTGLSPKFLSITDYVEVEKAIKLEEEILQKYKSDGWKILNKAKTGSIGGSSKWTKEKCILDALKYKTRKEWFVNSSGAYKLSLKSGWHLDCCKHMLSYVWTDEELKEDALKYNTKKEWEINSNGYHVAYRRKVLNNCCQHMKNNGQK